MDEKYIAQNEREERLLKMLEIVEDRESFAQGVIQMAETLLKKTPHHPRKNPAAPLE